MNITAHALQRCRQRGIPEYLLEMILDLGVRQRRPHRTIRATLRKRDCDKMIHELKRLVQQVEKLKKGVSVVVSEEGSIITAYRKPCNPRRKKHAGTKR